jgi:hypothetical protein
MAIHSITYNNIKICVCRSVRLEKEINGNMLSYSCIIHFKQNSEIYQRGRTLFKGHKKIMWGKKQTNFRNRQIVEILGHLRPYLENCWEISEDLKKGKV